MFLRKMISMLLVVSLLQWALPTLSYSATTQPQKPLGGILLTHEVVNQLNTRLEYCVETDNLLSILEAEKEQLIGEKDLNALKIENLNLNVKEYKKQSEEFKLAYLDKNEALNKLQNSTPSRLVWYSAGAATATVVGIILMFLVTK